jgi:hypothetical protein
MGKHFPVIVVVLLLVGIPAWGAGGAGNAFDDWLAFAGETRSSAVNLDGPAGSWLAQAAGGEATSGEEAVTAAPPGKAPPLPLHTIEGVGGCLATPVAYLVNPGPEGTIFGMPAVSFTYLNTSTTKSLQVFAVTQTFLRRIEFGYAIARFDLGTWPKAVKKILGARVRRHEVYLHHFNLRGLVVEENSFNLPFPAVTAGVHFKINNGIDGIDEQCGGAPTALGYRRDCGIDYTLTLSKTIILGRPFIFSVGMRNSTASNTGFTGFTRSCNTTVEANAICLLTDWFALAYEFRQKEDPYIHAPGVCGKEGNWHTLCFALILSDRLTLAGGWACLGEVGNSDVPGAWGFQLKYEF